MSDKAEQGFTLTLSVISFLADIAGLSVLAFSIIAGGQITSIVWQLIGVVLVFLLGVGLGMIGTKGRRTDRIETVLKLFIWAYLIMACLTYVGIIFKFQRPYSLDSYISYFFIVALQIAAFSILRAASQVKDTISYAFAFSTMAVLHALTWLTFLFIGNKEPMQIVGEWVFWFVWTLYAIPIVIKGRKSKTKSNNFIQD